MKKVLREKTSSKKKTAKVIKSSLRGTQPEKDEIIPEQEWLTLTDEFINEHRPALEALAK
jgi:hypothetical protein